MNLEKLYELQGELDEFILKCNGNENMDKQELFIKTILAMSVELSEFANTTRCFKHWSKKGRMHREIMLEEYVDVWHFYLSIGNQLGYRISWDDIDVRSLLDIIVNDLTAHILATKSSIIKLVDENPEEQYKMIGIGLVFIMGVCGFEPEEVEQAYLRKHKTNYQRQLEGY